MHKVCWFIMPQSKSDKHREFGIFPASRVIAKRVMIFAYSMIVEIRFSDGLSSVVSAAFSILFALSYQVE